MCCIPARLLENAILPPSGDQAGPMSSAASSVSWVRSPSTLITYISQLPSLLLPSAMLLPSGDHAGEPSALGLSAVKFFWFEPSASITYTSNLPCTPPFLPVTNRIFEPSGDHLGSTSYSGSLTIRLTFEPSAFIT